MNSPFFRPIPKHIFVLVISTLLFIPPPFATQPAGTCLQPQINDIGDLNLNGLGYEIGDFVLYENYFFYGVSVFSSDPARRQVQIAASDVNRDGVVLRVSDLLRLVRVIRGDAHPLPLRPNNPLSTPDTAQFQILQTADSLLISSNSPVNVGGVYLHLILTGTMGDPVLKDSAAGLDLSWAHDLVSGDLRLLLVSGLNLQSNDTGRIPAGNWPILSIPFTGTLNHAEVRASTGDGQELAAVIPGAPTACPDLVIGSFTLSGPASAAPGDSVGYRLNAVIKNTGSVAVVDSFFLNFFISQNSLFTWPFRPLAGGSIAIAGVPAGGSVNVSIPAGMSIPIDYWPPGPAYLGVTADGFAQISECNDFNNSAFIPLSIESPPVSLSDSLIVKSVAIYAGQTSVSIPISLINSDTIVGIWGRVVFDSNLVSPANNFFERAGRGLPLIWGPVCSEPGAIVFIMAANDSADALSSGSGLIGFINLNILTTQDTVICIRLEDDPQLQGYRNQLYRPYGELAFPSLKPGNLLIGAGNVAGGCSPTAFKLGDLNLDGELSPADVVLLLNCLFLTGSWHCPLNLTDINCDGSFTIADVVGILNAAFLGENLSCP